MKKILLTTLAVLFVAIGMNADNLISKYKDDQPFVFVESGIEFAVFQDGQFDFNVLRTNYRGTSVELNTGNIDFSFNSGHNYDTYVQYDDYGAPIQIENTPIYYDYYGRVTRIGNIQMEYYNDLGLISRIGNMRVDYNRFEECITYGTINNFNVNYRFIPRHRIYRRPVFNRVIVFNFPYRRGFTPRRYDYITYRRNFVNNRRNFRVNRNFRRPVARVGNRDYNRNIRSGRVYNNGRANGNRAIVRNTPNNRNNNSRVTDNRRGNNNRVAPRTSNNSRNNNRVTPRNSNNNRNNSSRVAENRSRNNSRATGRTSNNNRNTSVNRGNSSRNTTSNSKGRSSNSKKYAVKSYKSSKDNKRSVTSRR